MRIVVVRYGEISLKSKPVRSKFEKLLFSNIVDMVGELGHSYRKSARILIETNCPKKICKIVSKIPGVVSCSPAVRVESNLPDIVQAALKIAKNTIRSGESFAVRTSREGKHEFTSIDVNKIVGEKILSMIPKSRVDLSQPDREIFIEVREDETYIFTEKMDGVGGLPVGSEGKVICVFDGHSKDLRAAFLMMKRGCEVDFLSTVEKVEKVRKLLVHHPRFEIFIPPKNFIEKVESVPRIIRFPVKRRAILRLGSELAKRRGAVLLVVSDGLDEIRKFGLDGLQFMDEAASIPVLRPLIGEDLIKVKEFKASRKRIRFPVGQIQKFEEGLQNIEEVADSVVRCELEAHN